MLISGEDTSYLCPKEEEIYSVMEGKGNNITLVSRPEDVPEDIVKIAAYCPGRLDETWQTLSRRWKDRFQAAIAGQPWIMENAAPELKERFPSHCRRVADILRAL